MLTGSFGYAHSFGSSSFDAATSVAADGAGNVYVAGSFSGTVDFDRSPGVFNLTSSGQDAFLAKYGPDGGLIWAGSIGGAGPFDDGRRLGLTLGPDGDVYLTGGFSSARDFDLGSGVSTLTADAGSVEAFVARYTPDGGLIWARALGGGGSSPSFLVGSAIAVDAAGNVYTAGTMNSGRADLDPGAGTFFLVGNPSFSEPYLSKLDAEGNFVWAGKFAGSTTNVIDGVSADDIAVDASQNLYVTGRYNGTFDFDTGPGTVLETAVANSQLGDAYIVKVTPEGGLGYFVSVASAGRDDGFGIAVDSAGNAYADGQFSGSASIRNTNGAVVRTLSVGGGFGAYALKLAPTGGVVWSRQWISIGPVAATGIALDQSTNALYLTGRFTGQADFGPGSGLTSAGGNDVFVMRSDTNGGFGSTVRMGGAGDDSGIDIAVNNAGEVFTAGRYAGTADFDPGAGTFNLTSASNGTDGFLSKLTGLSVVQPPVAADDAYSTVENTPLTVAAPGVFANDSEPDGDPRLAILDSGPAHGTLALNYDGSLTYSPLANFNGTDTFTYHISEGVFTSNDATVTITVVPVNEAPVARDDAYATDEDTPLTVAAPGLLGNDSDADGDPLAALLVAGPGHGTLTLNSDGSLAYTPAPDFNGTDAFTYRVSDGSLTSNLATVTVSVRPVNDAPVARDDAYATDEDTPLTVAAPGVLANDSDVEGDRLSAVLVSGPAHGTLALNSDGSLTYSPLANFNGTDTFAYRASDGSLTSGVAQVFLTVRPVNDAPVARDDAYATDEDTPLTVAAPGVLGNDSDADGDPLTAVLVSGPSHGTLTLNGDGSLAYTPAPDFNGTDLFRYRSGDGSLASNVAAVTITVRPVNDAPVAAADAYSTDEDTPVTVAAPGVLGNDHDADGDALAAVLVSGPAHGTLAINSDGSLTYTPAANFNGTDLFTYQASDGLLTSDIAAVTITVRPVNDPPAAADQTFAVPENSPNGTPVGAFQASDADGDALTYALVSGNTGGAFAIDPSTGRITVANGSLLDFETAPQYALTVSVTDPSGLAAQATATINLTDVPETIPVAIDIKPGESPNTINIKSKGTIEVAIFSSPTFDARRIDVGSLRFGHAGNEDSLSRTPQGDPRFRYEDLNGDGRLDLVAQVETERTGFMVGDVFGNLNGRTLDGQSFAGSDLVVIKRPGD